MHGGNVPSKLDIGHWTFQLHVFQIFPRPSAMFFVAFLSIHSWNPSVLGIILTHAQRKSGFDCGKSSTANKSSHLALCYSIRLPSYFSSPQSYFSITSRFRGEPRSSIYFGPATFSMPLGTHRLWFYFGYQQSSTGLQRDGYTVQPQRLGVGCGL